MAVYYICFFIVKDMDCKCETLAMPELQIGYFLKSRIEHFLTRLISAVGDSDAKCRIAYPGVP